MQQLLKDDSLDSWGCQQLFQVLWMLIGYPKVTSSARILSNNLLVIWSFSICRCIILWVHTSLLMAGTAWKIYGTKISGSASETLIDIHQRIDYHDRTNEELSAGCLQAKT